MADIIEMNSRQKPPRCQTEMPSLGGVADVVIFPGVRYEKADATGLASNDLPCELPEGPIWRSQPLGEQ
jgi:hypothetical protein